MESKKGNIKNRLEQESKQEAIERGRVFIEVNNSILSIPNDIAEKKPNYLEDIGKILVDKEISQGDKAKKINSALNYYNIKEQAFSSALETDSGQLIYTKESDENFAQSLLDNYNLRQSEVDEKIRKAERLAVSKDLQGDKVSSQSSENNQATSYPKQDQALTETLDTAITLAPLPPVENQGEGEEKDRKTETLAPVTTATLTSLAETDELLKHSIQGGKVAEIPQIVKPVSEAASSENKPKEDVHAPYSQENSTPSEKELSPFDRLLKISFSEPVARVIADSEMIKYKASKAGTEFFGKVEHFKKDDDVVTVLEKIPRAERSGIEYYVSYGTVEDIKKAFRSFCNLEVSDEELTAAATAIKNNYIYNLLSSDLQKSIRAITEGRGLHVDESKLDASTKFSLARLRGNTSQYLIKKVNTSYEHGNYREVAKYLTMLGLKNEEIMRVILNSNHGQQATAVMIDMFKNESSVTGSFRPDSLKAIDKSLAELDYQWEKSKVDYSTPGQTELDNIGNCLSTLKENINNALNGKGKDIKPVTDLKRKQGIENLKEYIKPLEKKYNELSLENRKKEFVTSKTSKDTSFAIKDEKTPDNYDSRDRFAIT